MRVYARGTLRAFWEDHPDSKGALEAWFRVANNAKWRNSSDVKREYGSASIINKERVIFNICGNNYRLIVQINYLFQVIYICFIGTHKEYDKIDVERIWRS